MQTLPYYDIASVHIQLQLTGSWNNRNKGIPNEIIRSTGRAITCRKERVILSSMLIGIAVNGTFLINKMKSIHARNTTTHPSCHWEPLGQKQS